MEGSAIFTEASSTSKRYIDTGLDVSPNDVWEVTYAHIGNSDGNTPVMGGSYSKTDSNYAIWVENTQKGAYNVQFIFGDGNNTAYRVTAKLADVTQFHTYKMDCTTGEAWIDGRYIGQASQKSSVPNPRKLCILGYWRGNSASISGHGAIKVQILNSAIIFCRS